MVIVYFPWFWLGVVGMVIVYFPWFCFVCSHYVAPGSDFKAVAWDKLCWRQSLSDKLSIRLHKLFVSTPWIAPIRRTIIEVKHALQLQALQLQDKLCVNEKEL